MFGKIKNNLYFPLASYFYLLAKLRLLVWRPYVIVITGSSGKTTLLSLVESQFKGRAKYSHHANSSFGIPFDILGIVRKTLKISEWIKIFISAPFLVFSKLPKQKIYIVEADCDRPGEGKFLSNLLVPDVVLWLSLSKTHSMNFDSLVGPSKFNTLEDAIAHEFGYFIQKAKDQVLVNSDNDHIVSQIYRTKAKVVPISVKDNLDYNVGEGFTTYELDGRKIKLPYLLPYEVYYSLLMTHCLVKQMSFDFDFSFSKFEMPPARSSFFKGINGNYIVDSTYNANFMSMKAVLKMYDKIKTVKKKWVVLGDMLEQGKNEQLEHHNLAMEINSYKFDKVILYGKSVIRYTSKEVEGVVCFDNPKSVLDYLLKHARNKMILFKGSRYLEGVIEHLLLDKNDISKLARRELVWQEKRQKFGL